MTLNIGDTFFILIQKYKWLYETAMDVSKYHSIHCVIDTKENHAQIAEKHEIFFVFTQYSDDPYLYSDILYLLINP